MRKPYHTERGYSLVELSIVLIIIGLLVGGVLAGQSLIQSARIKNTVSEADNYKKAVLAFRDQYQYLPGDIPNAASIWGPADGGSGNSAGCSTIQSTDITTCNGDNDGRIESTGAGSPASSVERLRLWQHLSNAGFIEGQYTGAYDAGSIVIGQTNPETPLGGAYQIHYQGSPLFGRTGHFVKFGAIGSTTTGANDGLISPKDAVKIDRKYDDGQADSGDIVALDGEDTGGCVSNGTSLTAPSSYILSSPDEGCRMYFWFD